ncbi:Zn finger [Halorubrum virus HRTV-22]|nr:Zn finger [Halorubrum virus HRTV-19]UBF19566.1 Zn finger [Halorubrum virus HRTV-23]UBF20063.1 Zn finger [Halorubrum virus HRTV-22]UBF20189.1 Zn finger [Halorubrum virus HRTV-26]
MALECEKCDGPRLNGTPVTRDKETGEWRIAFPSDSDKRYYCRSCAREVTQ